MLELHIKMYKAAIHMSGLLLLFSYGACKLDIKG